MQAVFQIQIEPDRRFAARLVDKLTSWPILTTLATLIIIGTVFWAYGQFGKGTTFFTDADPQFAQVYIRARGNLSAAERHALVTEVEREALQVPGIEYMDARSTVVSNTGGGGMRGNVAAPANESRERRGCSTWRAVGTSSRKIGRIVSAPRSHVSEVPRAPRIAAGVFTRIASGDCLAIFPDTTDSVPWRSDVSNAPWLVVESNAKRSIDSVLFGPAESRLASRNAMPTAPSAPVTITSLACTRAPTGAVRRCAPRSM